MQPERNAAGALTLRSAAEIVFGAETTTANLLTEAHNVLQDASRNGYKFFISGSAALPIIRITCPPMITNKSVDADERTILLLIRKQ